MCRQVSNVLEADEPRRSANGAMTAIDGAEKEGRRRTSRQEKRNGDKDEAVAEGSNSSNRGRGEQNGASGRVRRGDCGYDLRRGYQTGATLMLAGSAWIKNSEHGPHPELRAKCDDAEMMRSLCASLTNLAGPTRAAPIWERPPQP